MSPPLFIPLKDASEAPSRSPGDRSDGTAVVYGPLCWIPDPLECAAALKHPPCLMLFSVDLKPESSEKCHRHRTGVLNRSNANYPCARGYSCGVRFPRPLPPSDPTECCRLCLLAPLRVSYHGQDVRPRANPTSAPVPLSPAELTVGQIRDVALGAARCMQFRIQNWLVLSAKFARNQFRSRESVEPKRCASSGSSLSRSTRSYAANHLAIAFFLTHFVAASEAAADNADIASWLKGMPKFSGLLRDYFIWQWEWSNWLGARYPELHLYLFGAAISHASRSFWLA